MKLVKLGGLSLALLMGVALVGCSGDKDDAHEKAAAPAADTAPAVKAPSATYNPAKDKDGDC